MNVFLTPTKKQRKKWFLTRKWKLECRIVKSTVCPGGGSSAADTIPTWCEGQDHDVVTRILLQVFQSDRRDVSLHRVPRVCLKSQGRFRVVYSVSQQLLATEIRGGKRWPRDSDGGRGLGEDFRDVWRITKLCIGRVRDKRGGCAVGSSEGWAHYKVFFVNDTPITTYPRQGIR